VDFSVRAGMRGMHLAVAVRELRFAVKAAVAKPGGLRPLSRSREGSGGRRGLTRVGAGAARRAYATRITDGTSPSKLQDII
jgi:hypothetical protein